MQLPKILSDRLSIHKAHQLHMSSTLDSYVPFISRGFAVDSGATQEEVARLIRVALEKIAQGQLRLDLSKGAGNSRPIFEYRSKVLIEGLPGKEASKDIASRFLNDHFSTEALIRNLVHVQKNGSRVCWQEAFTDIVAGSLTYVDRLSQISGLARLIRLGALENLALSALIARSAADKFVSVHSKSRIQSRYQAAMHVLAGNPTACLWLNQRKFRWTQAGWTMRHPQLVELNAGAVLLQREPIFQV